jgi:hypothetical protein
MTKTTRQFALLLAGVLLLSALVGCKKKEEEKQSGIILDYATQGVIETHDPNALQKAYDEAVEKAREGMIALTYRNDASSEDGQTFNCYIGNSTSNSDDLFIAIYADSACTDELFRGQLLRPGTAYETVTLNRKLDEGVHTVYVPHTLIRVVDGQQAIVGQTIVTMDFHVDSDS